MRHILTGFGFGPIQAGLFIKEAFESGRFDRLVVAEVDRALVNAVRRNKNSYTVNVAGDSDTKQVRIGPVELKDPSDAQDLSELRQSLALSTEVVTALPSVQDYDRGSPTVAEMIAAGLQSNQVDGTYLYAAENDNRAAEELERCVQVYARPGGRPVRYLNTVIGKMSRVVDDPDEIRALDLAPIAPDLPRALLVEEFNHILVTQAVLPGFAPGLALFQAKEDLLPFEEAKLYGHNAVHALMAYLGHLRGYERLTELAGDDTLMSLAENAFLHESGAALRRKYAHLDDPLFTEEGFRAYAEDLLRRMTNPFLADRVARVVRHPLRKLQPKDRFFGTMALALDQDIVPTNMSLGAVAALQYLLAQDAGGEIPSALRWHPRTSLEPDRLKSLLQWVWSGETSRHSAAFLSHLQQAWSGLEKLLL